MAVFCKLSLFLLLLVPSSGVRVVGVWNPLDWLRNKVVSDGDSEVQSPEPEPEVIDSADLNPSEHKPRRAQSRESSRDVGVSAMRFCQKLAEYARDAVGNKNGGETVVIMKEKLKGAQQRCQAALTHANNFTMNWGGPSPTHDKHGRVDRFTSSLHWSLAKVCSDECEELVKQMEEASNYLVSGMLDLARPSHEVCANFVVRKVEADILGCCGRSCGWDEAASTCRLWPLFDNDTQALWQEECCSEYTVLNGSKRQVMCDSVLNPTQKEEADQDDPKQQKPDDDKLVGQSLLQLPDDVKCSDNTYLSSLDQCGPAIEELPSKMCDGLKGWQAISRRSKKLKGIREAGCHTDKGPGNCTKLAFASGTLFEWNFKKRTQECCQMKEWPEAMETTNAEGEFLMNLMTKKVLVRKPKP